MAEEDRAAAHILEGIAKHLADVLEDYRHNPNLKKFPKTLRGFVTSDASADYSLGRTLARSEIPPAPEVPVTANEDRPLTYPQPDVRRRQALTEEVRQVMGDGVSTEQLDRIVDTLWNSANKPLAIDSVTGFYDGRTDSVKSGEVIRAQKRVAESTDDGFWVSADIANLGGLNQYCHNQADVANEYFRDMGTIFRNEWENIPGVTVVPMRTGGDELGAVVMGPHLDEDIMAATRTRIHERLAQYAEQQGLSDIEHPKHPGDPAYRGVGLHMGYAQILPEPKSENLEPQPEDTEPQLEDPESNPDENNSMLKAIFTRADLGVDADKHREG